MATTKEHAAFVKNMDKLDKILSGPKKRDVASICATYNKIKPIIKAVLPVLAKIPVVGKIAAAIELLLTIADSVCTA